MTKCKEFMDLFDADLCTIKLGENQRRDTLVSDICDMEEIDKLLESLGNIRVLLGEKES